MIRYLDKDNRLYYTSLFPKVFKKTSNKRYSVTLGIGGNIGDVIKRFHKLISLFFHDKRVDLMQSSVILKNPPFGYLKQDNFYNSILIVKTMMHPKIFLRYLLHIEKKFGRVRAIQDGPRTLDLDIILIDNLKIETKELIVPHPSWHKRRSVIIPLINIRRQRY